MVARDVSNKELQSLLVGEVVRARFCGRETRDFDEIELTYRGGTYLCLYVARAVARLEKSRQRAPIDRVYPTGGRKPRSGGTAPRIGPRRVRKKPKA